MNKKVITVKKVFDCKCSGFEKEAEYNEIFVRTILNYCHDILKSRGYLFLNEVYVKLDFPMTRFGQVAGWVYDEECMGDTMWTMYRKNEHEADVHITFEPLDDITDVLLDEEL